MQRVVRRCAVRGARSTSAVSSRRARPEANRPYKAFGYPVLPALYIVGAFCILAVLLLYRTATTIPGIVIILSGVPVFFLLRRRLSAR